MPRINIKPISRETAETAKDYTKKEYWEQEQEDITIIFLNKEEQRAELTDISKIEKELDLTF